MTSALSLTLDLESVDFAKGGGTVPVVVQDCETHAVLMVAYADREALEKTLFTGRAHFRSRTRGLWEKGATSGHYLDVVELALDCDRDTILYRVKPHGPTCHTGATTCFGEPTTDVLHALEQTIHARKVAAPSSETPSYTQRLLADRNLRMKKIGEEAAELILALADEDRERTAEEAADVLYHVMVALEANGVPMSEVRAVLAKRAVGNK